VRESGRQAETAVEAGLKMFLPSRMASLRGSTHSLPPNAGNVLQAIEAPLQSYDRIV